MEAKVDCKQYIWISIEPKILCTWTSEVIFKFMFINAFRLFPNLLSSVYCFMVFNERTKYKLYSRKEKRENRVQNIKGEKYGWKRKIALTIFHYFFLSFLSFLFYFVMILMIAMNFYNSITIYSVNSLSRVGNGS